MLFTFGAVAERLLAELSVAGSTPVGNKYLYGLPGPTFRVCLFVFVTVNVCQRIHDTRKIPSAEKTYYI